MAATIFNCLVSTSCLMIGLRLVRLSAVSRALASATLPAVNRSLPALSRATASSGAVDFWRSVVKKRAFGGLRLSRGRGERKCSRDGNSNRYSLKFNNLAAVRPRILTLSSSLSEADAKMWSTGWSCQG